MGLTSALSITESANPPRSVFVDAPLGHTAGPPNDAEAQRHILTDALTAGHALTEPGLVKLGYRWHHDDWRSDALGWSRKRESSGTHSSPSGDSREGRSSEPKYQSTDDKTAAEAVPEDQQCLVCLGL